jgi:hypothetical protein
MTEAFRGGDGVVSDHTIGISSADKKMLESSSEVKHFNSPSEFFAGLKVRTFKQLRRYGRPLVGFRKPAPK